MLKDLKLIGLIFLLTFICMGSSLGEEAAPPKKEPLPLSAEELPEASPASPTTPQNETSVNSTLKLSGPVIATTKEE
jgi:hypothetical protein